MWRGWCDEDRTPANDATTVVSAEPPLSKAKLIAVSGLEAGIIPQRLFPLRKWYYANPLWYYHAPALEHKLRTDAGFYELVDPALRELCRALFDNGLCSTPSCQGHFYPRSRFEKIWKELRSEANAIRVGGLVVSDSETDQQLLFKDAGYQLPWSNFDLFYAQAARHQNHGYLGIAVPANRPELARRLETDAFRTASSRIERDAVLSQHLAQPIFSVYVDAATPEDRDAAWQSITGYMLQTLQNDAARR